MVNEEEIATTLIKYNDGSETERVERVSVLDSAAKFRAEAMLEMRDTPMEERVFHPSHYTWLKDLCGIEVIDITRHMDFDLGNCVKYLLRAGHKKEEGYTDKEKTIEDLKKAAWYLEDKIKMIENGR